MENQENTNTLTDQEPEKKTPVFENNEKVNEIQNDQKSLEELKLNDSATRITEVEQKPEVQKYPSVATAREQEEVKEEYKDVIEESIRRAEALLANESPEANGKDPTSKKNMINQEQEKPAEKPDQEEEKENLEK